MCLITKNSAATFQCCCCDHKLCWFIVLAESVYCTELYLWSVGGKLLLVGVFVNTICYVCDYAEEICQLMFLRPYRAAGLGLNRFQHYIELDIK